jgi:Ca2+-binding EF-hand superfamily protein
MRHAFKELSKNNNGLVSYDKLRERLVSTGKLDAGESVLIIDHMVKTGKIEKAGDYNIYRIKDSASPNKELAAS